MTTDHDTYLKVKAHLESSEHVQSASGGCDVQAEYELKKLKQQTGSSYDLLVRHQAEDDAWRKEVLEMLDDIRSTLNTMTRSMRRERYLRRKAMQESYDRVSKLIESMRRDPTQPINWPKSHPLPSTYTD